jgi:hypothetical protein
MKKHVVVSWVRIALAILVSVAITVQLSHTIEIGGSAANFFSFFTIESNILAAFILLCFGIMGLKNDKWKPQPALSYVRGAITLYMTMTGIIYIVLLSGNETSLQTTIPWVNAVLHYIMPVAILLDWLLHPSPKPIIYRQAIWWLAFPVAYLFYTLIRGPIVQWYPYPFLNPTINGWSHVVMMCFIITIGVIIVTRILVLRPFRR